MSSTDFFYKNITFFCCSLNEVELKPLMIINESAGYMSAQYMGIKLSKFKDLGVLARIHSSRY